MSISSRYLLIVIVALGGVASAIGLLQYQRAKTGLYEQLETSAEAVLGALENVLASAPELFEPDRLQPVVSRFTEANPSVDRVSVIDNSYRIIADSDPELVGTVTRASALIRVIQQDRPNRFYYRRGGRKYYRSSRPIHGAFDPVRKSVVIGSLAVDINVSPVDARVRRDLKQIFLYLFAISGIGGAGLYLYLRRSFVAPLLELGAAAERIGGGDYSVQVRARRHDELGDLGESFNRMGRDLAESTQALEEAHRRLVRQERLAALGELAGSVAHELRNPLGTLRNSIYFLRMTLKLENEKAIEHLELMERQVGRTNSVITELLDYARKPSRVIERVALREVAERAFAEVSVPETVTVERLDEPCPVVIEADPGQVERILINLLQNAIQAMPEGGTLRLGCRRANAEVVATINDTGIGISEEDLPRIFEPLHSRRAAGIGLGLALSQRYAHLNGGRIECESELGKGATFRLILPASKEGEPGVAQKSGDAGRTLGE